MNDKILNTIVNYNKQFKCDLTIQELIGGNLFIKVNEKIPDIQKSNEFISNSLMNGLKINLLERTNNKFILSYSNTKNKIVIQYLN